jgi:3-mercaptopyruvate sulfurtransferase SseA
VGSFGEVALQSLLTDPLPPGTYGIWERVLDGKVPAGHIKSTVDRSWKQSSDTRFKSATRKADELDQADQGLREDFRTIARLHEE